ncbi:hypothetical protein ACH5RR_037233 [Cinchona calisaya]|uniref:MULE transposase domain-containing protein n=1 Tax=Cinchona calisaya TaxID=153742 RepID=A0ABD2Y5I6_9GENT
MQYQHMEKGLVDEGLSADSGNSDSSWHALDEDYESGSDSEDISDDDSDENLGTNNDECHTQEDVPAYQPRGMAFFNDLGNYGEYDPMDRSDKDGLIYWNKEKNDIQLHMYFESKEQVTKAVTMWSIAQQREFKVIESRKRTWAAKCKTASSGRLAAGDCDWSIRVRGNESLTVWNVTKWVKDHVCLGEISGNNNRNHTSTVIANQIMHLIENDPGHKVKQIQAYVKNSLKVDITYKKVWYARRKAIVLAYKSWASNFQQLPQYVAELLRSNPQTVVQWLHHPNSIEDVKIFKYIFWAFRPSIDAFHMCRPVLCVDGTHLRGEYRGKLLIAVALDTNNQILPVAYAIVDEETIQSWGWFMEQLRHHVVRDLETVCIISDRHRGIVNDMSESPLLQVGCWI